MKYKLDTVRNWELDHTVIQLRSLEKSSQKATHQLVYFNVSSSKKSGLFARVVDIWLEQRKPPQRHRKQRTPLKHEGNKDIRLYLYCTFTHSNTLQEHHSDT